MLAEDVIMRAVDVEFKFKDSTVDEKIEAFKAVVAEEKISGVSACSGNLS